MCSNEVLRILHYIPSTRISLGGVVRTALDISTVLAVRGHEIIWMTSDATDVPPNWLAGEPKCPRVVEIEHLRNLRRLTSKAKRRCAEVIRDADVVHLHGLWSPSNAQLAKISRREGKPWIINVHGVLDDWCMQQRGLKKRLYLATLGKAMVDGAASILTTAEEEHRQASQWLKNSDVPVIPCIVDLEPYKNVPSPQEAIEAFGHSYEPTVLFLSRVHEKKSIETLIDATSILKRRGTPVRVLIAGTGEDSYVRSLQKRAESAGVGESITFLGMVVGDLKLSLYAMADVFALPTQQENFGIVYPEAMLCETPVIGTKGTDVWRELEEGGAIIADRTPEAFADAIMEFVGNPDLAKTKGQEGRKYILKWLDNDLVAKLYEELYTKVITEHQS